MCWHNMDKNISVRHRQKTDIALSWALRNPVLLIGEIGVESDTGKIKIGMGYLHGMPFPILPRH